MSTYPPHLQALCLLILCVFQLTSVSGQASDDVIDQCHFIQDPGYIKTLKTYNHLKNTESVEEDTVGIYFEIDYALYTKLSSSTTLSLQYLNELFFHVQSIYADEGISLKISGVKIWDTPDPYENQSARNSLLSFAASLEGVYNGHLAHLLSGNPSKHGGLAYLSGLCDRNKSYAYSNVYGTLGNPELYYWDIHVVAHEIGHNLGAPHTNDCLWGPNNDVAIDGCGQTNTECSIAPFPSEGGTIMSSCHTNPVGVNLQLGLGAEPGALIRSVISSCFPRMGGSCDNPMMIIEDQTYTVENIVAGNGALQTGAEHSMWYRYIAQEDGMIRIGSCDGGVDTRLHMYRGECGNLEVESSSDDHCHSGDGFLFASLLDSIEVHQYESIWIEWDDKWSADGFEWQLYFYDNVSEKCSNGILDEGEEDIDCGPTCQPCTSPCENLEALSLDNDGSYYSDTTMMMNSMIQPNTSISLSTPSEVIFESGSEISINSTLEIYVEDCPTYQLRLASE